MSQKIFPKRDGLVEDESNCINTLGIILKQRSNMPVDCVSLVGI